MTSPQPTNEALLLTTGDLLSRARSGDREAIEVLFGRYRQVLQNFLHKRLPHASRSLLETQDLVQEVLTRVITALPSFEYRGIGSFWAYLRQIALNHLYEIARKSQRTDQRVVSLQESSLIEPTSPSLLAVVSGREEFQAFEKGLAALSSKQREALLLRVELELSYDTIATECGFSSADAARMAIVRTIKQMCQEMRRAGFKA